MNRVETTKSLAAESRGAVWLKAGSEESLSTRSER